MKTNVIEREEVQFCTPTKEDGAGVWTLVKKTGVLDLNSSYSYLLWCEYFSQTTIVAKQNDVVVGFISAFIKPEDPEVIFVWQVAVDESQRGKGLATKMLHQLLDRTACESVQFVEATISPSNKASQALFRKLARDLDTECNVSECFSDDDFPEDGHEEELTHRIGPFKRLK